MTDAELNRKIHELWNTGKNLILEMGENIKSYLEILLKHGVKNSDEIAILFGMYLELKKDDSEGYKTISKSGFEEFLLSLPAYSN